MDGKGSVFEKKGTGIREDLRLLETKEEKENLWYLNGETIDFWKRGQFMMALCSKEEVKTIKIVEFDELMQKF